MKKIIALALIAILSLSLVACSSGTASTGSNLEGSLEEIMNKLIETVDVDAEVREYVLNGLSQNEVTADMSEYYLGKSDYSFKEALAAEPMISAQAFSLVLVRANSTDEAQSLKDEIKASADPRKWLCVGVEDSDVQTAVRGDLVLLVMAENSDAYITAFNNLA